MYFILFIFCSLQYFVLKYTLFNYNTVLTVCGIYQTYIVKLCNLKFFLVLISNPPSNYILSFKVFNSEFFISCTMYIRSNQNEDMNNKRAKCEENNELLRRQLDEKY